MAKTLFSSPEQMTCYLFWLKFFRSVTRRRRCCRKFSYFLLLLLQNSWANFNQTWLAQSILGGFRMCFLLLLWFSVPLENFSLIWKCHLCRWRAADFDLCSTLMTHCATAAVNFVQLKGHAPFPIENNSENVLKTFKGDSPNHWAISTKLATKHPWLKGDLSLFK